MTTADAEALLKIVFNQSVVDQIISWVDCLEMFNRNSDVKQDRAGRYVEMSNLIVDPEGVGSRAEDDYLPAPKQPKAVLQKLYLKYHYMMIQLTNQLMTDLMKGEEAYLSWMTSHMVNVVRALKNDLDRQIVGNGSAIIARVNRAGGGQRVALPIDSAFGDANFSKTATDLFRKGASYRFSASQYGSNFRSGGGVKSAVVESIDRDAKTVTFKSDPGIPNDIADNDFIFRGDDASSSAPGAANARNKEIMGLLGHVDDGGNVSAYFGLDRNNENDFLVSKVWDGSTGPYGGKLSEELLMSMWFYVDKYGDGMPTDVVTTQGVWLNYWKTLVESRRINDPRGYIGGADSLKIVFMGRELEVKIGNRLPAGLAFMLDRSTLHRAQTLGLEWADKTGAIWHQVNDAIGVKDAYYAYGRWYMETYCDAPFKNTRVEKLEDTFAPS